MIGSVTYSAIANVFFEVALIMLSFPPQYCAQIRMICLFDLACFLLCRMKKIILLFAVYYFNILHTLTE